MVNGMDNFDGYSHLDILLKKLLRYLHHQENDILTLREGVTPTRLKLKNKPAINYII